MQIIKLELDHENFFCPVTGKLIRNDEMFEPSAATAFVFAEGDFQHLDTEFEAIWDSIEASQDEDDSGEELFAKFTSQITNESIVCFEITTRGMACGPVCTTAWFGIDMNYCADAEDGEDED